MRIVDTKGQSCPVPLIATKRALKETEVGESFTVMTDNQTSFNNINRFLKDNFTDFQVKEDGGIWAITITKTSGAVSQKKAEDDFTLPNSHFEKGNFIVVLSSDKMGEGDDELGHLLMGNFIMALKDLESLPQKILFYNKGVALAKDSSKVIAHLKDLENMGVELLLCSTCVNYYSLEKFVNVGTLSNMYVITEVMASAGNILRP